MSQLSNEKRDTLDEVSGALDALSDPKALLAYIVEHQDWLGYDPYFADLRRKMLLRAEELSR